MVEIKNTKVYNLEEAVIASGNAMRIEPQDANEENFNKGIERCKRLAAFGGGSGHTNFRTGILVSFDLKYPQYFTKQLQRYHFIQYVSSTSMMHRITKMDFSKCTNRYVSPKIQDMLCYMTDTYNMLIGADDAESRKHAIDNYKTLIEYYKLKPIDDSLMSYDDILYNCYMHIISNCPMGAELWVHCTTNYEQLATIYKQRKRHRLKEDWGEFCKFIEELPFAKELILNE